MNFKQLYIHAQLLLLMVFISYTASYAQDTLPELDKVYSVDSIEMRAVPDTIVTALQQQKDFEYANDAAYWKSAPPAPIHPFWLWLAAILQKGWLKWILYFIIAALLIYALYKIVFVNRLFLFYKSANQPEAAIQEYKTPENWNQLINDAVHAGNYKLAVRNHYLQTLSILNNKNIISYHPETTNQEYMHMMTKYTHAKTFNYLTRVYEYAWYGNFDIAENDYQQIASSFHTFNQSV